MGTDVYTNRFSERFINLADSRLGAKALFATDDFFAPVSRMLDSSDAIFIPGKFDDNGKWMDGWESRRKRVQGYDYAIVKLGRAGVLFGVDIDTSHFRGNHPPSASLEGCYCSTGEPSDSTLWDEVLGSVDLEQDSHHLFDISSDKTYSHLRLNIYPDGGVARLRVYGVPDCDWTSIDRNAVLDLASPEYGGLPIACSNQAFGSSMFNLVMPGRGINMGDGWETARRRVPGNEWVIIQLGHAAIIQSIDVDTAHYKGNYPDQVSIQAGCILGGTRDAIVTQSMFWPSIVEPTKLKMDAEHRLEMSTQIEQPKTHVRINMHPDGGISRVRVNAVLAEV